MVIVDNYLNLIEFADEQWSKELRYQADRRHRVRMKK